MSGFSTSYQLTLLPVTIVRLSDGAAIPADPNNADWQRYLAWQAAGGVPTPAPAVPNPVTIPSSAYMARFTSAELTAWETYVLTHSTSNSTILLGTVVGGATWAWIWTVLTGPTVTLTDAATVSAHAAMIAAGILTQARSTAILTP